MASLGYKSSENPLFQWSKHAPPLYFKYRTPSSLSPEKHSLLPPPSSSFPFFDLLPLSSSDHPPSPCVLAVRIPTSFRQHTAASTAVVWPRDLPPSFFNRRPPPPFFLFVFSSFNLAETCLPFSPSRSSSSFSSFVPFVFSTSSRVDGGSESFRRPHGGWQRE